MDSKQFLQAGKIALPDGDIQAQIDEIVAGLGSAASKNIDQTDAWTPVFSFSGGGSWDSTGHGISRKVDGMVLASFFIRTDSTKSAPTGSVSIAGLPHPVRNSPGLYSEGRIGGGNVIAELWANNPPFALYPQGNTSSAKLMRLGSNGHVQIEVANMDSAAVDGNNVLHGFLMYYSGS